MDTTSWNFESGQLPYRDQLYKTALRMTRSVEETEDLLQETYLKAYKYYERFSEGTNFKAWLFKIMKNTFINSYRKKKLQPPKVDFDEVHEGLEETFDDVAELVRLSGQVVADVKKRVDAGRVQPEHLDQARVQESLAALELDTSAWLASVNADYSRLRALDAERKYRAARKHWESYLRWKEERNRDRAKLEAKHGYDTKHAAHLVRLMRTGIEVLEMADLRVRRPDAPELMKISKGRRFSNSVPSLRTMSLMVMYSACSESGVFTL